MTREYQDPPQVATSRTMMHGHQDPPQVPLVRLWRGRISQDPPLLRAEHATIEGCALLLLPAVSGCGTVRWGASLQDDGLGIQFSNFYWYWFYLKWVWDRVLWSDKIQWVSLVWWNSEFSWISVSFKTQSYSTTQVKWSTMFGKKSWDQISKSAPQISSRQQLLQ